MSSRFGPLARLGGEDSVAGGACDAPEDNQELESLSDDLVGGSSTPRAITIAVAATASSSRVGSSA